MTKLLGHPQFKDAGDYVEVISGEPVLVSRLLVDNETTYVDKDGSNNMTFTDAVTGTKTLAELVAAGASGTVDISGTPQANDYAQFTDADTVRGRDYTEVKQDLSLDNVENTKHSTDAHTMTIDGVDVSALDAAVVKIAALENPPTEDDATKTVTSEWAFDHDARDATSGAQGHATAAQITKLDAIAANATKYPDTGEQAFLDADASKLDAIAAGATVYPDTGEQAFLDADHSKLDAIAANATKYPDTGEQAFLDADHSKLDALGEEITTVASDSTPNPTGGSLRNFYTITALAAGATFAAPSGSPANANKLIVRIKDNGTTRSLAWNEIYRAMEFALPTDTTANKTMYLGFIYNSADTKWDMVAINEEA